MTEDKEKLSKLKDELKQKLPANDMVHRNRFSWNETRSWTKFDISGTEQI